MYNNNSEAYWNGIDEFGHWGICDDHSCLYPQNHVQLIMDMASGKDFDTGWHGFKKELQSMRIKAHGQSVRVSVSAWCDDLEDLISTDSERGSALTDSQYQAVLRRCEALPTEVTISEVLARNSRVPDVLRTATNLAERAEQQLADTFDKVEEAISAALDAAG